MEVVAAIAVLTAVHVFGAQLSFITYLPRSTREWAAG